MAYDPNQVLPRDQVRFLIADTDNASPLLQDAELDAVLSRESNIYLAAAIAADSLAARYARRGNISVDGLSVSNNRAQAFRDLAADLRSQSSGGRSAGGIGRPYAGGISIADRKRVVDDADRIAPRVSIGMHDNPAAPPDRPRERQ